MFLIYYSVKTTGKLKKMQETTILISGNTEISLKMMPRNLALVVKFFITHLKKKLGEKLIDLVGQMICYHTFGEA